MWTNSSKNSTDPSKLVSAGRKYVSQIPITLFSRAAALTLFNLPAINILIA